MTKLDTQVSHTPSSSVHVYSTHNQEDISSPPTKMATVFPLADTDQDYDLPNETPMLDNGAASTHDYSVLSSDPLPVAPATVHYYSSPPLEDAPLHSDIANVYDEAIPPVPSTNDPVLSHSYDEIRVPLSSTVCQR